MIETSQIPLTKAQVLDELQRHNGREQGIHIRDLVARITNSMLCGEAEERKVRKLIEELRREKYPIFAHPDSGYYMAATPRELNETCAFLLARAETTVAQVAAMKNTEAPDIYAALGVHRPRQPEKDAQQ